MAFHHDAVARQEAAALLSQSVPLRCGVALPNRIAKAAMSEQLGTIANAPDQRIVRLYECFGASGAGLLITGNVMIDRRRLGEPLNIVLEDARHAAVFRDWATAARAHGAHVWMQINHPGRQVPRGLASHPVAPSAVPLRVARGVFGKPRALRDDEILEVIGRFGRTARLAREAGFDGVQIHGAHGYLVSQFLAPRTNRRTDGWGGSLTNRMRFARELVREVRRVVGAGFPIGFKLNCSDFVRDGFGPEEAALVGRMLDDEGVDLIEVSGGSYESAAMLAGGDSSGAAADGDREAFFIDFATRLKASVGAAVMLTGGNRTAVAMADAIGQGKLDLIGIARPAVARPEFPRRLLDGEEPGALPGPRHWRARAIDAFVQTSWHERQMHRLAAGREPSNRMTSLGAMLWGLRRNTFSAARVRRRRRLDGIA